MATYLFSTLGNHQTLDFDPASDRIFFDQDFIAAAGLTVWQDDGGLHVYERETSKEILLSGMTRFEVTTANLRFADGSRVLFGDNSLAAGDDQANSLSGTIHADYLHGWGGDDTLAGGSGADRMDGGNQDDRLEGGAGNDQLFGGDDQDTLYGDAGADTLYGGAGDDRFGVENAGDVVTEFDGGGDHDLVISSVDNYFLPAFVEELTLWGDAVVGYGNDLDNILVGTSAGNSLSGNDGDDRLFGRGGSDWLNGGGGDDTMAGGAGRDSYFVDSAGDVIVEEAGGGRDRVYPIGDYTLVGAVEDLVLWSSADGTGNALDNRIYGSDGTNRLSGLGGDDTLDGGGWGTDTLRGGDGADTFRFTDQPGTYTADRIFDFLPGTDRLVLLNGNPPEPGLPPGNEADYGSTGRLDPDDARFYAAPGARSGHDADDRLVYDTDSGKLYYDPDGDGPDAALLVFTLRGAPSLAATDITVVDHVAF